MSRFDALRHRLTVLLRPRRYARELDEEMRLHLELDAIQQHADTSAEEARFAARRRFGNVTYYGEETRRMTSLPFIDAFSQDLRHALRTLRKSPGFTLAVVLTLALGIGANTAIFSVVDHLLLHPLPYADAGRMVFLWETGTQGNNSFQFVPTLNVIRAWKAQARSFDGLESYTSHAFLATGGREAQVINGVAMTPGLPAFLGAHPLLGRGFVPGDTAPDAPPVVLISEARWRRDYGSSPSVLGQTITLDGTPRTIVGVMPAHWDVLGRTSASDAEQLWLPLSLTPVNDTARMVGASTIARLRGGVTLEQAQRELADITAHLPDTKAFGSLELTANVMRPRQALLGDVSESAVLVMLAAAGLVLLVACANVANLLLARGTARAGEVALRAALGASRWRLVRHVMVESVVLSLVGGALGVLIARGGLLVIMALRPDSLNALVGVRLDPLVLEFTLTLSLVTAALFGLVPAFQTTSAHRGHVLQGGASTVVRAGRGRRFRATLVAGEMALSVILLVSAGLLVRSVMHLQHLDVGFNPHNLFALEMSLPRGDYALPASRELLAERMLGAIRRVPGVAGVTQAFTTPAEYGFTFGTVQIAGRTLSGAAHHAPIAMNRVYPDYFRTIGVRLLHGRTFNADEMRSGAAVIISEAMARRFFPSEQAVGKQLRIGSGSKAWETVVGVVADVAASGLIGGIHVPQLYAPYREAENPVLPSRPPRLLFIV